MIPVPVAAAESIRNAVWAIDRASLQFTGYQLAIKMMDIRNDIPSILCTGFSETVNREKSEYWTSAPVIIYQFYVSLF